ncbi:TPA: hypothetical protein ACGYSL_002972 [Legionella pneumophila]
MEFYTYLTLHDLKTPSSNNGIILPCIDDFSSENLEYWALEYIKDFEPCQLIEFSSWLNMIFSVKGINASEFFQFQNHLLQQTGWPTFNHKILFHRYNTLSLIGLAAKHIKTLKGKVCLSANSLGDCGKYIVALAILNCHIHNEHDFIRQLIRDYPNYLHSDFVKRIYFNRIIKSYLLFTHQGNSDWDNLISSFEKKTKLEIKQIVKYIAGFWQYYFSNFNLTRAKTFFINDSKFKKALPIIKYLSTTTSELGNKLSSQNIELYNVPIETVLRPIMHKEKGIRFPMDFLSIIDTNGALAYEIFKQCYYSEKKGSEQEQYKTYKDKIYSVVSEDIFINLIKRIFPKNFEETRYQPGYPECIVKDDASIILFEYTTQEPGYYTIFSQDISQVKKKYSNILICRTTQKNSKAKFDQISNQIGLLKTKYPGKSIFPILVTDNHFGDFDLLNEMDYFLTRAICEKKLQNLQENKITILSMDDIFFIFRYEEANLLSNLTQKLALWNSDLSLKREHCYSFSAYLISSCNGISENYKVFCNSTMSHLGIKTE